MMGLTGFMHAERMKLSPDRIRSSFWQLISGKTSQPSKLKELLTSDSLEGGQSS
jgi:hypothetical protein